MRTSVYTIAGFVLGIIVVVALFFLQIQGKIYLPEDWFESLFGILFVLLTPPLFFGILGAWLGSVLNKRSKNDISS